MPSSHRRWQADNAASLAKRTLAAGLALAIATAAFGAEGVPGLPVYVVRSGDTIATLALRATGDSLRFGELIQYNPEVVSDEIALTPGMSLRLPPGWTLPGARVPPGERPNPKAPPPPSSRAIAQTRGAATPPDSFGGAVPMEAEMEGPSMLEVAPPSTHPLELFTFFPELGRLDDEFEQLMLRAALAGDITWAARTYSTNREEEKDLLEEMITGAEQTAKLQEARYDACAQAKRNAEALLRKFRFTEEEVHVESEKLLRQLGPVLEMEHHIWQDLLWNQLPYEGTQIWTDFTASLGGDVLNQEQLAQAVAFHDRMAPFRVRFSAGLPTRDPETGEAIIQPWTEEEQQAIDGIKAATLLDQIIQTTKSDAYHKELIESERYDVAIAAIAAEPVCKRGLVDAQVFLKELGRKVRAVEEAVSRGDTDSISADAERIARRYQAALGEVQLIDAFISNEVWAGLWWKSGVALKLAGHHDEGNTMLEQAAAVDADHILPADMVPPSIQTWFTAAESVVRARESGALDVTVHPDMKLTIDGVPKPLEFGVNEHLVLKPGIHRVVFWFDGSEPITRLVGVVEGEDHTLVWYEPDRPMRAEQQTVIGDAPMWVRREEEPIKRWFGGISGVGGAVLGRPVGGADLTVRYMPKVIGGQLGGAVLVPDKPLWLGIDDQMNVIARIHGSVVAGKRWDRFGLIGGAGAYVDPLLGAGPLATFEASVRLSGEVRIALDARFGWDLTPHFAELDRWTLTGGLGVWF